MRRGCWRWVKNWRGQKYLEFELDVAINSQVAPSGLIEYFKSLHSIVK